MAGSNAGGLNFWIEQTLNRTIHRVQQTVRCRLNPGIFQRAIPVLRPSRAWRNAATNWRQCGVAQPDQGRVATKVVAEDLLQNSKRNQSAECYRNPVAPVIHRVRMPVDYKEDRFAKNLNDRIVKEVWILTMQSTPVHCRQHPQLHEGAYG